MELTIFRIKNVEGATAEIIATDVVAAIKKIKWRACDCNLLSERVVSAYVLSVQYDRVLVDSLSSQPYIPMEL